MRTMVQKTRSPITTRVIAAHQPFTSAAPGRKGRERNRGLERQYGEPFWPLHCHAIRKMSKISGRFMNRGSMNRKSPRTSPDTWRIPRIPLLRLQAVGRLREECTSMMSHVPTRDRVWTPVHGQGHPDLRDEDRGTWHRHTRVRPSIHPFSAFPQVLAPLCHSRSERDEPVSAAQRSAAQRVGQTDAAGSPTGVA